MNIMRMRLVFFFFVAAMFGHIHPASAHPHAWISVRTTILVNEKGEATSIREHWLFDKTYSAFALRDFNPNKNGILTAQELFLLAQENISNLKEYSYFTMVEGDNEEKVTFDNAKDVSSDVVEVTPSGKEAEFTESLIQDIRKKTKDYPPEAQKQIQRDIDAAANNKQIEMEFTLPFMTPQSLRNHSITYRIYDPSYYTDITHFSKDSVKFVNEKDGKEIRGCQYEVELPKIDASMVFNATALDWNATAPKDFGYSFSEKVTLSC